MTSVRALERSIPLLCVYKGVLLLIAWSVFGGFAFGQAVRSNTGFNTTSLAANDDGSSAAAVNLGFGVNFFGVNYSSAYVNNNGNITFNSALSTYTPQGLSGSTLPIIAPFWADVDTRATGSSVVKYGADTVNGRQAFGVNYVNVGYYNNHADKLNSFQVVLINRSDTGANNFDIEFNYDRIVWETGDASSSGGINGLGGISAAVGYSNGTGTAAGSFQLQGSQAPGSFLDSSSNGLTHRTLNSGGVAGRLLFSVRNGVVLSLTSISPTSAPAGSPAVQLQAAGTGFVNGSVVRWTFNAQTTALATQYQSASSLSATIPATLLTASGSAQISVVNPSGDASGSLLFTVGSTGPLALDIEFVTPQGAMLPLDVDQMPYIATAVFKGNNPSMGASIAGGAAKIRVTAKRNGIPVPDSDNLKVDLSIQAIAASGGHTHQASDLGLPNANVIPFYYCCIQGAVTTRLLSPSFDPTLSMRPIVGGVYDGTTITAGELSLDLKVMVQSGQISVTKTLRIEVPGLVNVKPPTNTNLDFSGITGHEGWFGLPAMNTFLTNTISSINRLAARNPFLCTLYRDAATPLSSWTGMFPLDIQGVSLPRGGFFDINKSYSGPHSWHRLGNDIDLGFRKGKMTQSCRLMLSLALISSTASWSTDGQYVPRLVLPVDGENSTYGSHFHAQIPRATGTPSSSPPLSLTRAIQGSATAYAAPVEASPVSNSTTSIGGTTRTFKYTYDLRVPSTMPLGVQSLSVAFAGPALNSTSPLDWLDISLGNSEGWFWGSLNISANAPGVSMGGFSIQSQLPPAIHAFRITGPVATTPLSEEEFDDSPGLPQGDSVQGFTLAPHDSGTIQSTTVWSDLILFKSQAVSLGWIDNSGMAEIDNSLNAIQGYLTQGSSDLAYSRAVQLLSQIANRRLYMNAEGYALLNLNTLFLLDQLRPATVLAFAGNGTAAFGGDGGQAIQASLQSPYKVAVDGAGSVYIADLTNNRIRKVTSNGVISTVVGTAAQLNGPSGVAVDSFGNIFVADSTNNRIRKITPTGVVTTVAGTGTAGYGGDGGAGTLAMLDAPNGLALDGTDNLYIADTFNNRIRKLSTNGVITTVAGNGSMGWSGDGGSATAAMLNRPRGVFVYGVTGTTNIYIADTGNNLIRKVVPNGTINTVAGNGFLGSTGNGGNATAAQLAAPWDVLADSNGNFIIAESEGQRIRKVTGGIINALAGAGTTGSGGDGGPATAAQFNRPRGLAMDVVGTIYVADAFNNKVRRIAYTAPGVIGGITPAKGNPSTIIPAVIDGIGLSGATGVQFSGTGVTATIGAGATDTTVPIVITIAPGAATGPRTVGVVTTNGASWPFDSFTVANQPVVQGVQPAGARSGVTVSAVITGSGMSSVTGVTFSGSGLTATILAGRTATTLPIDITISPGAAPGARTITLSSPQGSSDAFAGFSVVPPPAGSFVAPSSGSQGSTLHATISGTDLNGATVVAFSGTGVTATIDVGGTATILAITISVAPGAQTGQRTITVTAEGATSAPFGLFTVNAGKRRNGQIISN